MRQNTGQQRLLRHFASFSGAILVLGSAPLGAQELDVRAFPETVRLDLESGALLESRQAGGPTTFEAIAYGTTVSAVGVRDEVLAFQIRVSGQTATLAVSSEALVDESGLRSELVPEIFVEQAIRVERASQGAFVHSLGPGVYPDVLISTSTLTVPAPPSVAVLWVDLWIPPTTTPGRYQGRITIGAGPAISLELRVSPALLPDRDVARLGAVNFGSFVERARVDPASMLAWMQMMHAHHLSVDLLTPPPAPPPKAEGGYDWDAWAAEVGPYVDGTAFARAAGYRGPRAGLGVSRWVIPVTERWPAERTEARLPSDPEAWARALAEWEEQVQARGWFDLPNAPEWVMFINGLDEPKSAAALEALLAYEALIERARLADRRHLSFRVDGPFGQGVPGWSDARLLTELGRVADVFNVCGAPPWIPWSDIEARRRSGETERFMFYASSSAGEPSIGPVVVDAPLVGMRAWAWIVDRYQLSGALNWEVDVGPGCVRKPDCTDAGLNLDASLIFRGEEVGRRPRAPVPSIRLKALRRGAQDVAILSRLRERDPEAARILGDLVIPGALGATASQEGLGGWPKDPKAWDGLRAAMIERIEGRADARALEAVVRGTRPGGPRQLAPVLAALGVILLASIWGFRRFRRR